MIFTLFIFYAFSKPICCSPRCNFNTLEVLEAETLSLECASQPICQHDCPCRDPQSSITGIDYMAAHFDVSGTNMVHVYHTICTIPKIDKARRFVNAMEPRKIEEVFRSPRSQHLCTRGSCGGWAFIDGQTIQRKLFEFINVLHRLCERGEITNQTPLEFLLKKWIDYLAPGKWQSGSEVEAHREILENLVSILIKRCPCVDLVNAVGGRRKPF